MFFSISCSFRNVEDGFEWTFSSVTTHVVSSRKEWFREVLGVIKGKWEVALVHQGRSPADYLPMQQQ